MTQQLCLCVYPKELNAASLERFAHPYSQQHCSQQPGSGSNTSIHWQRMNKLRYNTVGYYSALKRSEVLTGCHHTDGPWGRSFLFALAALGLLCCAGFSLAEVSRGLLLAAVRELLLCSLLLLRSTGSRRSVLAVWALSTCGVRTQYLRCAHSVALVAPKLQSAGPAIVARSLFPCSMWDLPGPEIKPVSPASAGRFPTTREVPLAYFYLLMIWGK